VRHHFDSEGGYLTAGDVGALLHHTDIAEFYICGPEPFMELIETTLDEATRRGFTKSSSTSNASSLRWIPIALKPTSSTLGRSKRPIASASGSTAVHARSRT
jgi:ferredoxin-NADP reductase